MRGPAFFAYSDNYLIDVKSGIIMDVETSRAIRQAEVNPARTHDRAHRAMLCHQARTARGRYGLRFWSQPQLAGQRSEERAAYPGGRQVKAQDGAPRSGGLHIRQGAQRIHLSGRQGSHHDW